MNLPTPGDADMSDGASDVPSEAPVPLLPPDIPRRGRKLTRRQALGALGAFALPWEHLFAQSPGPATVGAAAVKGAGGALPPDLVNLHVYRPHMQDETFTAAAPAVTDPDACANNCSHGSAKAPRAPRAWRRVNL
jgi:hypothetical protein